MDTHRNWTRYIAAILLVLTLSLSALTWSTVEASTEIAYAKVERIDVFITQQIQKHGLLIEVVSGQSFSEYMQEHIFVPLEMQQSFTSEEEAQEAGMAQDYQWLFGLPVPRHHCYNPSQLPSGYLIASAEDISHLLISQLNDGSYALDTKKAQFFMQPAV